MYLNMVATAGGLGFESALTCALEIPGFRGYRTGGIIKCNVQTVRRPIWH